MKHVIAFSGGKDSTALLCWAEDNLPAYTVVFCDTGWENQHTYDYIQEIFFQLKRADSLEILTSKKYPKGMRDLVQIKGRVPSAKARFCTENLKVDPMAAYLAKIDDEVVVYQGIRRNESEARMRMKAEEWSDVYDCLVKRPLFHWTAEQCFEQIAKHGMKPNPLYLKGVGRVGCFPCVLINQRELKVMLSDKDLGPIIRKNILELEQLCGRAFFEPSYIPERFCTGFDSKSGKSFPWAKDVFDYIEKVDRDQLPLLPERNCMSVYNLCE